MECWFGALAGGERRDVGAGIDEVEVEVDVDELGEWIAFLQEVARDGDGEDQEGEGGVRDGPGEFEVGMKDVGEVDELFVLLVGARGSTDTVINVAEEEMRDGA
eukprot:g26306.t1